jgi:hypothetical protein
VRKINADVVQAPQHPGHAAASRAAWRRSLVIDAREFEAFIKAETAQMGEGGEGRGDTPQ